MLFIPIHKLRSGMKLSDNVLVFDNASNVTLLKKGKVLTQRFINRLRNFQIPGVYVCDEITGNIMPSTPTLDIRVKTKTLHDLEWAFTHANEATAKQNETYAKQLDKMVVEFVNLLKANETALVNISDLKSYDDYTYHHSLSVSLLSIAVGMQLHLSEDELRKLGFAAIMHDIGKMNVPIELINKKARLSDKEFEIVKQHSTYSGDYLILNHMQDPMIHESVISHHEKCNGTGYPRGLKDKDIPFFSKIISVADVYDAITSHRPYRTPEQPTEAAEYLMGNCGNMFDLSIVRAFLEKIEFFPIGSFVQLNTGQKAIVTDNTYPLRPVVKLIEKPHSTLDLFGDPRCLNIIITKLYTDLPAQVITELTAN